MCPSSNNMYSHPRWCLLPRKPVVCLPTDGKPTLKVHATPRCSSPTFISPWQIFKSRLSLSSHPQTVSKYTRLDCRIPSDVSRVVLVSHHWSDVRAGFCGRSCGRCWWHANRAVAIPSVFSFTSCGAAGLQNILQDGWHQVRCCVGAKHCAVSGKQFSSAAVEEVKKSGEMKQRQKKFERYHAGRPKYTHYVSPNQE